MELLETIVPTPILNTPDFKYTFGGKSGSEIPLNARGQPECFEFVALKGMVFEWKETLEKPICRISCPFYKGENLFIDRRFTKAAFAFNQKPTLPTKAAILKKMSEMTGTPYVWGGNWSAGIPEMQKLYPPKGPPDERTSILWSLKGVDCSGLLFEATLGASPRNSSDLVYFGQPVPAGSSLEPLDMILFPGHVVFVLDEKTTIESQFPFGVIQRDLSQRLMQFERERGRVENWRADLDPGKFYTVRRFL
jgi:hypothetical protein